MMKVQLTATVEHKPYQASERFVGFPLNKSLVLGAKESKTVVFPYKLSGAFSSIYDTVASRFVKLRVKGSLGKVVDIDGEEMAANGKKKAAMQLQEVGDIDAVREELRDMIAADFPECTQMLRRQMRV
ncbi:hypothetical protein BSKO_06046 [Bryopsis sp. KO-2023]|nr:hypothetical protein BSKO_06046 [Bryopsis sp. KO-2023]